MDIRVLKSAKILCFWILSFLSMLILVLLWLVQPEIFFLFIIFVILRLLIMAYKLLLHSDKDEKKEEYIAISSRWAIPLSRVEHIALLWHGVFPEVFLEPLYATRGMRTYYHQLDAVLDKLEERASSVTN